MTELVVRVIGHEPAPQGSFSAALINGRAQLISASKKTKPWRIQVAAAARNAITAARWTVATGPVQVEVVFWLPRPATVRRELPSVRPDVDKLARAALDAITDAPGSEHSPVLADDALVTRLIVEKRYADGRPPGATIRVTPLTASLL